MPRTLSEEREAITTNRGADQYGEPEFTTGEAAVLSTISQQQIIRCIDAGLLKAHRVPGSKFRRIRRSDLYKFLKDNGMPTQPLGMRENAVLTLVHYNLRERVERALKAGESSLEAVHAESSFDCGMRAAAGLKEGTVYQALVADDSTEDARIVAIARQLAERDLPIPCIRVGSVVEGVDSIDEDSLESGLRPLIATIHKRLIEQSAE